jgi:hypothetical protein
VTYLGWQTECSEIEKEDGMSDALSIKTAVCSEYESLLEECQSALESWNQQRAEIFDSGLRGKRLDDELRRLQARFARAYAVLQKHAKDCVLCQFMPRINGDDSESNSQAVSGSKLYA